MLVADEACLVAGVLDAGRALELARRARLLALPFHRRLEAGHVDRDAALAANVRSEVDREAVRVVQQEHGLAVEQTCVAALALAERAFEDLHAVLERLAEALLFLLEHAFDARLLLA